MAREKKQEDISAVESKMTPSEILASVQKLVGKEFGKDIMTLAESDDIPAIPRLSTGITALDYILGGGFPVGRVIEIMGPESSGKTTIALHAIAEAQKRGVVCGYIDAEHAYDPVYAKSLGVNNKELLLSAPLYGEQSLALTDALIRTGSVGLIVIDSVAALTPKKELDGDFGDSNVGLHARLMSQAMRKLVGPAETVGCTLIFINQIREKVGVMYGSPETTTGGRALRYYSSVRLDVRKKETLKEGKDAYANHVAVKTVKNKTFPPMKSAEFDIFFGKGVDNTGSVVDLSVKFGLMSKGGGGYYTLGDIKVQGRPKMVEYLESDEGRDKLEELTEQITTMLAGNKDIIDLSAGIEDEDE